METKYVIVFESTHHALASEQMLLAKNFDIKMIPTPREITLSCGLSILFSESLLQDIIELVERNVLIVKGVYKIEKGETERTTLLVKNAL